MRVFFLAATTLCLMGMAASAQPSKMRPEGSGLVEYVALTPASGPISDLDFEVSKIEFDQKRQCAIDGDQPESVPDRRASGC